MSTKSLLKKNKYIYFLSAFALFLCGIATDGHCLAYYKPAYEGRVVDLSTGKPIEGAVVAAFYNSESYGVIQMISGLVGYRETVTDKDGFFHFYPYFSVTGPLTFTHRTTFIVYKPGYQSIDGRNLEPCLTDGCDKWGDEKYGVVITGNEVGLQKIYMTKERWRAMPSFSSRDYNRAYDELLSTQMLTEEYEFLASLNDIHWPYYKLFRDDPWEKSISGQPSSQEELSEAEIKLLLNNFTSDEYTVHWQAYKKLLSSGDQVVPYVHALLDTIEPAKRPKVTKLLWEIGDPSSVDRLCEELLPEHNAGFIEEQQVEAVYIPDLDNEHAAKSTTPQVKYRTVQKRQTIDDIALALRAFPARRHHNAWCRLCQMNHHLKVT